jgi:hypothetical protein
MNQPKEIHLQRKALISDRLPTLLANDPDWGTVLLLCAASHLGCALLNII